MTSLRAEYMRKYPDFPWLDPANPEAVARFLAERKWLEPGETFVACEKAGEGNMNLTLRIRTDRRSFILKQARPWVEKYDFIAAPWDRGVVEQRFYERVRAVPEVARLMPRFLHGDAGARAIALEDYPGARDLTSVYHGG